MKRSLEYGKSDVERVASVGESVETSCFLSNVLMRDLQEDLSAGADGDDNDDGHDQQRSSLRNADIE